MHWVRHFAAFLFLVIGAVGCDMVQTIDAGLSGEADATLWFWAKLQGIQWRGNQEITRLNEANAAAARASDLDGVARGFSTLSEKHAHLATQLLALDANKVDEAASSYRERLVAAHQALSEEFKTHASATTNRDTKELSQGQARLKSLLTDYAQLCNEKDSVMATLKDRYHQDFNVAE